MKYFKYFFSFFMLLTCTFNAAAQFIELRMDDAIAENGEGACVSVYIGGSSFSGVPNLLSLTNVQFSWNSENLLDATVANINSGLWFNNIDFTFNADGGGMTMDFIFLECSEENSNSMGIYIPDISTAPTYLFDICFGSTVGNTGDCLPIIISNPADSPPVAHRSFTFNEGTGSCPNISPFLNTFSCVYVNEAPPEIICESVSDSLALVAFYHATGGDDWDDNTNWLVEGQEIGTWYGVTTNNEECVTSLNLKNNHLAGEIPSELGNLPYLTHLSLHYNQLSGGIPPSLGNLHSLTHFIFYNNQLSGNIPIELGNLINLKSLSLHDNQLTGSIPSSLGNLFNLTSLDLGVNFLTDTIPLELGNLSSLRVLNLGHNQLTGNIPTSLGNLSNLIHLYLSKNELTGNIPSSLGNLSNLIILYLKDNQLAGNLPAELGNLTQLEVFFLENNNLEGIIPSELGNMSSLYVISLSNNNLSGSIPSALKNIPNLASLKLNNNQLSGRLPIYLSNFLALYELELANNQFYGCFPPQYSSFCAINNVDFTGNLGLPNSGDFTAFCESGTGACDATITGQIIFDKNDNCVRDSLEVGLQQWMIKATSTNGSLYSTSDTNGYYSIFTYPEEYMVALIPSGEYWEENCTGIVSVNIIDSLDLDTVNFFTKLLFECPVMEVDISTALLRRCLPNTYVVNYCNSGTIPAEDASVAIQFADLINIDSVSIDISTQVDNILTFDIGDVAVNECASFYIYTHTSCDAELGQTLCATAHIYPDSICADISPAWSGATVEVGGECEDDEVTFVIKNTGDGDMLEDRTYIIIEDGLILLAEPQPFILNSNGDIEITYPANGSTYICQAMQVDNHPLPSMPTAFVEACGTNEDGGFSTGYVTQFPEDDNAAFVSIDCQEVIGSFDPNDKNGYPKGYGEEHFIERGQAIDYHIRFQNTGTDTAFTVVVEDVLSPNLDIESLRLGASSHPYSIEILGNDTLKFIFEHILLADSTINEPASHGFLKFKISQKVNLDLGTTIENQAAIFFDFNEPVLTNTTWHTIGEDFVKITATRGPFIPNLKVSLAPNPLINEASIHISGIDFKNAQFSLFNTMGVLLREESFNGDTFILKKGDLLAGIYFFEIKIDGQKGFVGKMVVE